MFRPMELSKSCSISKRTTMMSSCATAVPSFGLQVTTMAGPITWCKKLVSLPAAPLEVRHPRQHLRLMILRLTAQRAQADLSGLHPPPPSLLPRALLERRSTQRRRRTQTVRRAPRAAPQPTPAPTDCVVASGVTADQRLDTAEIAARVEIVGPREYMSSSLQVRNHLSDTRFDPSIYQIGQRS